MGNEPATAFAELAEADATGAIAALYADMRAVTGLRLVNLIWRHLATLPGMLEWTWGVVRPLHVSGLLQAEAARLLRDVRPPENLAQPACVFEVAGVTADDRRTIAALIADYERGNSTNLLSLLAVLAVLQGARGGGQAVPPAVSRAMAGSPGGVPRLLRLDELAPPVRALALALDGFGRTAPSSAVASLYRHLGHWPGFLVVAHAALAGHHRSGALRAAHEATLARGRAIMTARLLPVMPATPLPDTAAVGAAIAALEQFTTQMIARMVVMGRALAALLDAPGPGTGNIATGNIATGNIATGNIRTGNIGPGNMT